MMAGTAPSQPWGEETPRVLAHRILNHPVQVEAIRREGLGRGRRLAVIHQGSTRTNLWLVQSGLACY